MVDVQLLAYFARECVIIKLSLGFRTNKTLVEYSVHVVMMTAADLGMIWGTYAPFFVVAAHHSTSIIADVLLLLVVLDVVSHILFV